MIGVILACGKGTRLRPFTKVMCKCLLPVYDKPTLYFAVKELTDLGIKDIIIITLDKKDTKAVLSNYDFKAKLYYKEVKKPKGPVEVLKNVKRKLKGKKVWVVLGDTYIPFPLHMPKNLDKACMCVSDNFDKKRISEFGVVEIKDRHIITLEEKPKQPKGKHINIGITYFPNDFVDVLKHMPEHFDLIGLAKQYLKQKRLKAQIYHSKWFGVGTPEDLFLASQHRKKSLS